MVVVAVKTGVGGGGGGVDQSGFAVIGRGYAGSLEPSVGDL